MKYGKMVFIAIIFSLCGCATASRSAYVDSHPEWAEDMKEAVLRGELQKGMRREHVHAILGKPRDVRHLLGAKKVREEVTYKSDSREMLLYFENDALISWQPVEKQVTEPAGQAGLPA